MAIQEDTTIEHAELSLPQGGGAIAGIGEKFQSNRVTGTGGYSIPLPLSPGRSGFAPPLGLNYDSGSGNSPFGLGWSCTIPAISRKTSRGIPAYNDRDEEDTFLISGAEDLVPVRDESGTRVVRTEEDAGQSYQIYPYRPRIEGLFAKIERWVSSSETHWRVRTKEGIVSVYGVGSASTLRDPNTPTRVFTWYITESRDSFGNRIRYEYKGEDHRESAHRADTNSYLKRVYYTPMAGNPEKFHFQLLFDYGEHTAEPEESQSWSEREDAFSSYRSGFEIRTRRLCQRVMLFHNFPGEEGRDQWELTKEVSLVHNTTAVTSYLTEAVLTGVDGGTRASLPPLKFTYSSATIDPVVRTLDSASLENLPVGLDTRNWQWLDINGEGVPGIAIRQGGTIYFKENLGDGRFGSLRTVATFPNISGSDQIMLSDIDGDGNNEFTVRAEGINGYYRFRRDCWEEFVPFAKTPTDMNNPNQRMLDLTGDGRADIVITEGDQLRWYPSCGESGYDSSRVSPAVLHESMGPRVLFSDATESIHLADMSGDGLTDILRIRNGEVCYWPNMGYGVFGAKRTMAHAPRFESAQGTVNQQYIKLGDIDGSGTTDILYFGDGSVRYWHNCAGNGFSEEQRLPHFPRIDSLSSVSLIDLKGRGTLSLVWSSNRPGQEGTQLSYIDILTEKPHLLTGIDNSRGMRTTLSYLPSTWFYLEDKKRGTPWRTKLLFPVQVLHRVTQHDLIGDAQHTSEYRYHHGYFDAQEREFRGFGMVETFDVEEHEYSGGLPAEYQAPVHTKEWFHTGAMDSSSLSNHYRSEYYQGDRNSLTLGDSRIENWQECTADELRQAYRALKNSSLRTEVYEAGHPVPYSVTEQTSLVRMIQPSGSSHERSHWDAAVFLVTSEETLTQTYDQQNEDPRVSHSLVLATDEYGHVTHSASLVYPRRVPKIPEQSRGYLTVEARDVINRDDAQVFRLGVTVGHRRWHLGDSLPITANRAVSREEVQQWVASAQEIPFSQELSPSAVAARLLSWSRSYYWNELQSAALPNGEITQHLLLHHTESAVFDSATVERAFEGRISPAECEAGGYAFKDGYWWNYGVIQHYSQGHFYLPIQTEDQQGGTVTLVYDPFLLVPIQSTNALGQTTSVAIDYRTLAPWRLTDVNGTVQEARTDPLGKVIVTTKYGENFNGDHLESAGDLPLEQYQRVTPGSLAEVVASPEAFLQDASTFFFYDLHAFVDRGEPVQYLTVARDTHVSDGSTGYQLALGYSDGFGREIQTKVKADSGVAWKPVGSSATEVTVIHRWLTSGRTVYNNKENPIKQYEPFYSTTFSYEQEPFFATYGVTPVLHYDALGRLRYTEFPDDTRTATETKPWHTIAFDQNDFDPASGHFNTPVFTELDSLGRPVLVKQFLEDVEAVPNQEGITTKTVLDIAGNPTAVIDPRGLTAFRYSYDMGGAVLKRITVDAGTDMTFNDALGKPIRQFDAKGTVVSLHYDILHRPTEKWVAQAGKNALVERITYGESAAEAFTMNLLGRPWKQEDSAGITEAPCYDFVGVPLMQNFRLRALESYQEVDLSAPDLTYESEVFTTANRFDALGRMIHAIKADGSHSIFGYHPTGTLKSVKVSLADGEPYHGYIETIFYDAKGQRQYIRYSNDTETYYRYHPKSYRLTSLKTCRYSDPSTVLQEISYDYDSVGNVVEIVDTSKDTVYDSNKIIEAKSEFVYDALYRLKEATGREKKGLNGEHLSPYTEQYHTAIKVHVNDSTAVQNYKRVYSYDVGNNLTQIKQTIGNTFTRDISISATSNRGVPASMGRAVDECYDVNGNLTELEHLQDIQWDWRNMIVSATRGNDTEYYIYNAAGERVRKVTKYSDRTEEKMYLGGVELRRITANGSLKYEQYDHHVMDDTRRIAIVSRATVNTLGTSSKYLAVGVQRVRYQYGNHLGSASLELDESGGFVSYQEYFPFGGISYTVGEISSEYRFTGKERDDFTGLDYFGARFYASWLGRWMSADPKRENDDGLNLFAYVRNSPVTLVDPDGLETLYSRSEVSHPIHWVQKGETLNEIAAQYGMTAGDIQSVNPQITDINSIRAGDSFDIPDVHTKTTTLERLTPPDGAGTGDADYLRYTERYSRRMLVDGMEHEHFMEFIEEGFDSFESIDMSKSILSQDDVVSSIPPIVSSVGAATAVNATQEGLGRVGERLLIDGLTDGGSKSILNLSEDIFQMQFQKNILDASAELGRNGMKGYAGAGRAAGKLARPIKRSMSRLARQTASSGSKFFSSSIARGAARAMPIVGIGVDMALDQHFNPEHSIARSAIPAVSATVGVGLISLIPGVNLTFWGAVGIGSIIGIGTSEYLNHISYR